MAVRHSTSPCISLGPFLFTYNKGTHSAKLRQITWVSSAIYRLFSEVVSKSVNSAEVTNVDKLCLDLHGIYSSTTSAVWSWLCGPDCCIQAKSTTDLSFSPWFLQGGEHHCRKTLARFVETKDHLPKDSSPKDLTQNLSYGFRSHCNI